MLENSISFPLNAPEAYKLSLPQCVQWRGSKKRILVVMQTVDGRDLRANAILGDNSVMACFKNVVKYTRGIVRTYSENSADAALTVANFNGYRHLHLKPSARKQAEAEFAKRIHALIAKIKPTHVLVSGDDAMHALWPQVDNHAYKRGWVHLLKSGELDLKVTSTLDFARLLEKDGQWANLLGFLCRHFANLFLGKDPHSLKHVITEPRFINTIEKFDSMMKVLYKSEIIATDTETRDLSVLRNAIYTIQFATDLNPLVGYVLPVRHPLMNWTKEELKHIRVTLRKFFNSQKKKQLVTFNGMYDLRVIRRELKLPIIWHDVWEITSGEHDLDENISELTNFGTKPGGLAAVYCSYGNDFYYNAAFSKADRATTGNVKPSDKNFLLYGATDVVSILHIRLEQIKKSGHQKIGSHNYKPYFVQHMLHQMSDTAHQLSHLREDGSLVDPKYLKFLTTTESPLRTEMKRLAGDFKIFPQAVEANAKIMQDSGLKTKGLNFGGIKAKAAAWVLSLSKPNHLRVLFFDVMGFEPVSETKTGTPSVDKIFIAHYKDKNPVVEALGDYTALSKLLGTYAKGWYKKLRSNSDSATDNHLRPDYSTFDVTTGRLASKNPSLHTIPARGKLTKIIKRMFVAPKGKFLIRYDYSAHEVRVWSYVGLDKALAAVFRVGQKLRQAYIANPTEENKKAIKLKGDIHILNVKRLLGKDVDKDHPLRDAIKRIIFGLLYGKSAETLGEDTKLGDKTELKELIGKLFKEGPTKAKELRIAEKKLAALMAEDRTSYAQGLVDKIFKEFSKGGAWTNRMKKMAEEEYYVYSPIGRKRNLFAAMLGDRKIVNKQARRGSNAPIQGLASEIGVKAGRLVMEAYYKELPVFCKMLGIPYDPWELRVPYNRMVHDASYYSVDYCMVIPFIHILQYMATYGVTKAYKDEFNFEFTIEPEIELEIGVRDDSTNKWDWALSGSKDSFVDCVMRTADNAIEFGLLEGRTKDDLVKEIFKPWAKKDMREYLQKKYPLLNVPNLDKQIIEAIKPIYRKKDESTKVLDTVA